MIPSQVSLTGLLAVIAGILLLINIAYRIWVGVQSHHWATTPGVITESSIVKSGLLLRWPQVRFSYEVDQRKYEGQDVSAIGNHSDWDNSAQAVLDRYPIGRSVVVSYDPSRPHRSVLEVGFSRADLFRQIISAGFTIAFVTALLLWEGSL